MSAAVPASLLLPPAAPGLLPVVAYIGTSTDRPQYSTEHQLDRIREFAAGRGMEIIRVFADEGEKSLRRRSRENLRQLIAEVATGQPGFKGILVYDVSRWGRFQDAGESGYYEYLCQRAGITVHYCAEVTSA
jgi:DNA invertase Pin-like site-specific DNA recombinase